MSAACGVLGKQHPALAGNVAHGREGGRGREGEGGRGREKEGAEEERRKRGRAGGSRQAGARGGREEREREGGAVPRLPGFPLPSSTCLSTARQAPPPPGESRTRAAKPPRMVVDSTPVAVHAPHRTPQGREHNRTMTSAIAPSRSDVVSESYVTVGRALCGSSPFRRGAGNPRQCIGS